MKRLTIIFSVIMFGFLLSACGAVTPRQFAGTPELYEYNHNSTMMWPTKWYCVEPDTTGRLLLKTSSQDSEIRVYAAPADCLERIGAIVRKHKLWKLKNSYTPPVHILDGYMWGIRIGYEGDTIYSGGSNAMPSGKLLEGISAINGYLQGLLDAFGEEDLLRLESHVDRRR